MTDDLKLCPKCGERQGWFYGFYVGLMTDTKQYPSYSRYMCAVCKYEWQELIERKPIDPSEPIFVPLHKDQVLETARHHPKAICREMATMLYLMLHC